MNSSKPSKATVGKGARPAAPTRNPATLAEELGGVPAEADPAKYIERLKQITAPKGIEPSSGRQPPLPVKAAELAKRPDSQGQSGQSGQSVARPASSSPDVASKRPWAAKNDEAKRYDHKPKRPPGSMSFEFRGRVIEGKSLDNGKVCLRVAGDGWYNVYLDAVPVWLEIGQWIWAKGIIAAGSAQAMYLWAREVSQIEEIQ